MAKFSPAVQAARIRRTGAAAGEKVRFQWFIKEVVQKIELTLFQRVTLATEILRNQIVKNISVPVTKERSQGRVIVTERSRKGEFPRADTTQLRKTIFGDVRRRRRIVEGFVGTPLDYGLILEVSEKLDRKYMTRTMNEMRPTIKKILTGPIKG